MAHGPLVNLFSTLVIQKHRLCVNGHQNNPQTVQWVFSAAVLVILLLLNYRWSARSVIGEPKVYPRYGDIHGSWATKVTDAHQFIEVNLPF